MKWTRAQDFCKEDGINKDTIISHNPEQNGYLKIFNFHVPKEKSTKMEAPDKNGMIVVYREILKLT